MLFKDNADLISVWEGFKSDFIYFESFWLVCYYVTTSFGPSPSSIYRYTAHRIMFAWIMAKTKRIWGSDATSYLFIVAASF